MAEKPTISAVVTDLDNTLWDWFEIWYVSFSAFLDALIEKTGASQQELLPQIKQIYRQYGTVEYSFVLEKLPFIKENYAGVDLLHEFKDAIDAHREARQRETKLYEGVRLTLEELEQAGVILIAYTESLAFYTARRIRNTELDGTLDYVYSPADHDFPEGITPEQVRKMPAAYYDLKHTRHRNTPRGVMKPSATILNQIIRDLGLDPAQTLYVGDSLTKDIQMAQEVGILDVHAEYGVVHNDERYNLLRKVTHWPVEAVDHEKATTLEQVCPSVTLTKSFSELLDYVTPKRFSEMRT